MRGTSRHIFSRLSGRHSFLSNLFLPRVSRHTLNLDISIEKASYVVIDLELTGLNLVKDSIISIGAIRMEGQRIILGDFFYREIQTDICKKDSIIIHGITPSESSLCPDINVILPEFMDYCNNRLLVGHFISIDIRLINKELKKFKRYLEAPFIDIHKIYRWLNRKKINADAFYETHQEGKSLFDIAKEMDIPANNLHNAIYDAFLTAQIFQRFIYHLKSHGLKTVKDLLQIGGET